MRRSDARLRGVDDPIAMAIYHLHVKVIGRKTGSSAVAAAAYRAGCRLRDDRLERSHDFSGKRGVVHSEVLLPGNAPESWRDRERLWNAVEAFEKRKDAQLAREIEFALPREMSEAQGIALARDFVQSEFVARGMIADLNVHWDRAEDGLPKPHAHVMLTMRAVDADGFGPKARDWNRTELVTRWRERWAEHTNERLAELDIDVRIDHRTLERQGIALEPQSQIGAPAHRLADRGREADRAEMHRKIARDNGARIIATPALALEAITHQQSTFTGRELAKFAHRHSDGIDQFNAVMGAMRGSPDLVELGRDGRGEDRFTTRQMIETEQRLHLAAELMAKRGRHGVTAAARQAALERAAARGLVLSDAQAEALAHVTGGPDLGIVVGHAGAGKSAMLAVAREAWEAEGFEVRGVALSGIAADNLESGSGIPSRTIASLEHGWGQGRDRLTRHDVLVIDEAGMVGTRQLKRVLSHATEADAKVVLVGDARQLQSIEAGAAFRSIHDRHGGVEIAQVRRQRDDWQREATRDLATGRTADAIGAYDSHDMVHEAATREQARADLVARWDRDRRASPEASRIILTHTNEEVFALNQAARERMRAAGDLGDDVRLAVDRGARSFARGDRIMFLQNERGLGRVGPGGVGPGGDGVGVKNGTLGTIEEVNARSMSVRTDDGRTVSFDLKDYNRVDHGYAATIHKAQGLTVDHTHVLATPRLDAHGSYVALSRHRAHLDLHYGRDDFASQDRLTRVLSRDRAKDMASDYEPARDYAERRGITFGARVAEIVRKVAPEKVRGRLQAPHLSAGDGKIREIERVGIEAGRASKVSARETTEDRKAALRKARSRALIRHARAVGRIFEIRERRGKIRPERLEELRKAREAFERLRPFGAHDAEAAYRKSPELVREAAAGRFNGAVRALQLETQIRIDADRFVEHWRQLREISQRQYRKADMAGYRATRAAMGELAKSLEREPQLESILEGRKRELGIGIHFESGRRLGLDLASTLGIDRGRGLGLGL